LTVLAIVDLLTVYGDAEAKRKALEGGADGLFTKPVDFGSLRAPSAS
jgi:DNA-binding response OmpR family regulator